MATREGQVSELTAPDGKGPGSAKVGNRKIRLWWTRYQSEEASEVRDILERALASGASVRVEGKEEEQTNKAGQRYTSFTATDAVILSANGGGLGTSSQGRASTGAPVADAKAEAWRHALYLAVNAPEIKPDAEVISRAEGWFRILTDIPSEHEERPNDWAN